MSHEGLTTGDLVALRALELGVSLDPWQVRALAIMSPSRPVLPGEQCHECGGSGLAWEHDEGGGHPVHCPRGCELEAGE